MLFNLLCILSFSPSIKSIKDWILESYGALGSYFNRPSKIEEIKNKKLGFKDGMAYFVTILLSELKHLKRLYEVIVLKKILLLNPDLKLNIHSFKTGIEIIFPSTESLINNELFIDEDIAKYYYEVNRFIKENFKKFDVIIGMYHDQILTPLKTLFGFNAINLTLGLPFIRISPDHGPNNKMLGQKRSDPSSLREALIFLRKINGN